MTATPRAFFEAFASAIEARAPSGAGMPFRVFARKRLWIRDKEGAVRRFVLNSVQSAYLARKRYAMARGKPARFLLLKYRRGGFSTLEQGLSYRAASTRRNMTVVSLADVDDRSQTIFRIARLMHERDPEAPAKKGVGNDKRLEFTGLNSLFYVGTAGGRAFGRGDTLQRVHGSEVSRWCQGPRQLQLQKELLDGLDEATSHGEIVLETTPRGFEFFHELYVKAKRGENDWTPVFLPWFVDRANTDPVSSPDEAEHIGKAADDRERELVRLHGLSPGQLKWRRRAVRRLGQKFREEYPEDDATCFLTAGSSYFNMDRCLDLLEGTLDYTDRPVPAVKFTRLRGSGDVNYEVVWEEPGPTEDYVAGCDTSEGRADSHFNGVGVLNRRTGNQAALVYGRFEPKELAAHAVRLCRRYNDALLGVERNNHGHAVLERVADHNYIAENRQLFWCADDTPGWSTDLVTRPIMLSDLADAVAPPMDEQGGRAGGMGVNDREFLSQCLTFKKQSNRKYEADPGAYDDAIFIWAIAWQMRSVQKRGPAVRWIQLPG